jgi:hypothetical protein
MEKGGHQMKKIIHHNKYPVNPVYPACPKGSKR